MFTLSIVRHGETDYNLNKICQGQTDVKLNARGKLQAERVAFRLSKERIDKIISSDLSRASETAQTIASYHKEVNFETSTLLREKCAGKYAGLPLMQVPTFGREGRPEGGESWLDVRSRATAFMDQLIGWAIESSAKRGDPDCRDHIVIVSHGGFIHELKGVIQDHFGFDWGTFQNQVSKNAGITTLHIDPMKKSVKLTRFNDVSHLAGVMKQIKASEAKEQVLEL
eukprot:Colp12_sorted_trinity150504_noHs@5262